MTHEQIDRMVRKANPVRDPNTLGSVDVPVLTTPLERRMEMQVDDRSTEVQTDRSRWRGPIVGIAAAALILVAGAIVFATNQDPVAEPAPNATPTLEMDFQPIEAGAYFADTDGDESTSVGGTFVIEGSEWAGFAPGAIKETVENGPYVSLLVAEVDKVWSPACGSGGVSQPAGTTAEDLANQVAAGFTVVEALSPVSAFGQSGYHLVVEVPAGCTGDAHMVWEGPTWGRYYQEPGQVEELWFLDVEGTPVLVEATWLPEAPEEDVAELRAVLDTLVITP